MERTLFEGEEHGLGTVRACAFDEDVDGLAVGAHFLRSGVEGLAGGFGVRAIDEDGF
jgi:hypothetical protein